MELTWIEKVAYIQKDRELREREEMKCSVKSEPSLPSTARSTKTNSSSSAPTTRSLPAPGIAQR